MRMKLGSRRHAVGLMACFAIGGMLVAGCGGDAGSEGSAEAGRGGASGDAVWLTSYEDAMAKSKETNRPVLALFTGSDW